MTRTLPLNNMTDEVYHLATKDILFTRNEAFKEFMNNTSLTDVTLVCDDNKLTKAHRIVLCSSSTFFKNIVESMEGPNAFIYLKGVKHVDLNAIIEFIYLGETNVAAENLDTFLETAQELKVRGLFDILGNKNWMQSKTEPKLNEFKPPMSRSNTNEIKAPVSSLAPETNFKVEEYEESEVYPAFHAVQAPDVYDYVIGKEIKAEIAQQCEQDDLEEVVLPFECNKCAFKCQKLSDLKLHDVAIHRNSKYVCDKCDYHTNKKTDFVKHMKCEHKTNIAF